MGQYPQARVGAGRYESDELQVLGVQRLKGRRPARKSRAAIIGMPGGWLGWAALNSGCRFLIDDTFLAENGVTEFERYRVDPTQDPAVDFFVPDSAAPAPLARPRG